MSPRIPKNIRRVSRTATQYPAVVVDIHGRTASARLSTNGATVHNLEVIGGPVEVGEVVSVDYTTPEPTIVAMAKSWLTQEDLDRALKGLQDPLIEDALTEYDKVIVFLVEDPTIFAIFSGDYIGLQQAVSYAYTVDDDASSPLELRDWALRLPPVSISPSTYGNDIDFWRPMHVYCEEATGASLEGYMACTSGCTFENVHFYWDALQSKGQYPVYNIFPWGDNDPEYNPDGNFDIEFKNCKFHVQGYDLYEGQSPPTGYGGFPYSNIVLDGNIPNSSTANMGLIFEHCQFYAQSREDKGVFARGKVIYEDNPASTSGYGWDIEFNNCQIDCGTEPFAVNADTGPQVTTNVQSIKSSNTRYIGVADILNMANWNDLGADNTANLNFSLRQDNDRSPIDHTHGSSGSGGGPINFPDLNDTPSGYSSQGGKLVAVKGTEDGLEFVTSSGSSGDMYKSTYDTNDDGKVNSADAADAVPWSGITSKPSPLDADAIHDNVTSEISAITEKASPVSADLIIIEDSAAGNAKKRVQIGNLPSSGSGGGPGSDTTAIHDNVDAEISAITEKGSPVSADLLLIEDSAASNAKKRAQVGNLPFSASGHTHVEANITDLDHDDVDAIHDNVNGEIAAITEKASPVSADLILIEDSAASNAKKRVQIGNLPSSGSGGGDSDAIHDNVSGEIAAITEKASPVGADLLIIEDSAASNVKKRVQITNLPTGSDSDAIHDNVSAEISAVTEKTTPVSADLLLIEDSAASNAKKRVQIGNLPSSGGADILEVQVFS